MALFGSLMDGELAAAVAKDLAWLADAMGEARNWDVFMDETLPALRAMVVDDQIVVRPMMNLTLGFDHRLVDGALADQYLAAVKRNLETWSEE